MSEVLTKRMHYIAVKSMSSIWVFCTALSIRVIMYDYISCLNCLKGMENLCFKFT